MDGVGQWVFSELEFLMDNLCDHTSDQYCFNVRACVAYDLELCCVLSTNLSLAHSGTKMS
jgi:hypothetical protein